MTFEELSAREQIRDMLVRYTAALIATTLT